MGGRKAAAKRWRSNLAGGLMAVVVLTGAAAAQEQAGEALMTVMGVVTPFATFGLLKHLNGIPGVESATFDLETGTADVRLKPGAAVTADQLREAARSASYTPGKVHWKTRPPTVTASE